MKYEKLGCVGRFKPLHLGGAAMLDSICEHADTVIIGIGSCNKYNVRNPFTADETEEMLHAHLKPKFSNYKIVQLPDYGNGEKWRNHLKEEFGTLDAFVSSNDYVRSLLTGHYELLHGVTLIPHNKRIPLCASQVRMMMAQASDEWRAYVPKEIATYIEVHHLDERFRKQFGLATLALSMDKNAKNQLIGRETLEEQYKHTMET
jgi:nicotinamide mononucleotide adenylyltransferase